ncbi:hypothetical protein MUK42_30211 [Musa troglodytarum]|uniref:Fe2OG dioxygenase domain-containing protein n=1 Tax=Musa troglodytarum TaxID=320322 RepID=A0A9E7FJK3_9LILI|nr:hypothetical protein MUK42_30211 [Musa troglodytarum]
MASQLLSAAGKFVSLPEKYVRPESQRPRLHDVINDTNIPIIDLGSPDKQQIVAQVADACRSFGFFQKMMGVASEFFHLPPEEKAKYYSDDPTKKMRLKESVRNWRDYVRLHCYPLEEFVPGFRLLGAISLSLELEEDYLEKILGEQEQHMAVNYYPTCPDPELTYGLPAHTDPNVLTILLQDPNVAGLQILKDGRWIAVRPLPNTLVVNVADQLQALSNGRYMSVRHRAVVNSDKERISVASFLCPGNGVVISPPEKLVGGDGCPAMYRSYTYDEYYDKFWSRALDEHCLDFFKR